MKTYKKIYLLFLFNLCFNQNAELITQQITIEEAIKRAREELARQQGNVGSNTGENTSPGGLIIPN